MLTKAHLKKYADVILWGLKAARTGKFKKYDNILIRFDLAAKDLAEIIQARILSMGMNPVLRLVNTPQMDKNVFELSDNRQLDFQVPGEMQFNQNLNGGIYLHAPDSITHLKHIEPNKIGRVALARKPARDILWKREEMGEYGWTLCMLPTSGQAKNAGVSPGIYTRQVIKACYLDKEDPVREWDNTWKRAVIIKKWLNRMDIKSMHIHSENIDLNITPGRDRRWLGVTGHNIPSFELFLSPDWRGTEGIYYANLPSFKDGNRVEGVRLEFKKGEVVQTAAEKGADFVRKQLSMDEGAKRIGEFSLTDKRFSGIDRFMANTLYDENFGGEHGNCHIAVGMSYSDTYSGNPSKLTPGLKKRLGLNNSAIHWDLVNTEDKIVTAILKSGKEKILYENGMFCCPNA